MTTSPTYSVFERFNPVQWAGPLFDKELRVSSRQRRLYGLRFGYIGILMLIMVRVYASVVHSSGSVSAVVQVSRMGEMAKGVTATIVWFQFVTGQILAAVLLGGSIAGEIRQRTFDVLLTTPMTSLQIVVGKLTSKLLQVVMFLAISLPMLAVVRVFGGVPWDFVLAGLCVTLAASVFVGAISLLFSVTSRRTQHVVGTVLGWCVIMWAGLSGVLAALAHVNYVSRSTAQIILEWFNPVVVMVEATGAMLSSGSGPPWRQHCLIMLGAAAVLLWLAIWRVRRSRGITVSAKAQPAKGLWSWRRGLRPVTGPPIVWKEIRKGVFFSRCRSRWELVRMIAAIGLVLGCAGVILATALAPAPVVCFGLAFITALGFLLGVTGASASAFTQEKGARTWPILLATPLSNSEIVAGKAIGSVLRHWPLLAFSVVMVLTAIVCEPRMVAEIPAEAFLYILAWLARSAGAVVFLVSLASYFGVCMRSTAGAVVAAVAIYLGSRMAWGLITIPVAMATGPGAFVFLMFAQGVVYAAIGGGVLGAAMRRLRRKIFL